MKQYSIFVAIVAKGKAHDLISEATSLGAVGATVFYGQGTCKSHLMHLLEIAEVKKEIVLIVIPNSIDCALHAHLRDRFKFQRKNAGICFTMPADHVFGMPMEKEAEEMTSNVTAIFTIVDRGMADQVIDIAEQQGSKGATVIHGRGSGIEKKHSFFNLTIEPEKEVVFILVQNDKVEAIVAAIDEELMLNEPGHGILFTVPVTRATGLVQ